MLFRSLTLVVLFFTATHFATGQYAVTDSTFGTQGSTTLLPDTAGSMATALAYLPDGKIVVTGYVKVNGQYDVFLMRLLYNGNIDSTFGTNGKIQVDISGGNDQALALALQPDGKILIGGYATVAGRLNGALLRLNAGGAADNTFGTSGTVLLPDTQSSSLKLTGVVLQPNGQILASGTSDSLGMVLYRFNSNGTPDQAFINNTHDLILRGQGNTLALQADGKILVGGALDTFYIGSGLSGKVRFTKAIIRRYNSNGFRDFTFSGGYSGHYYADACNGFPFHHSSTIGSLLILSDGKIIGSESTSIPYVSCSSIPARGMLKLNSNGTPANGFGDNLGFTCNLGQPVDCHVNAYAGPLLQHSNEKFLQCGNTKSINFYTSTLTLLKSDNGKPDAAFSPIYCSQFDTGTFYSGIIASGVMGADKNDTTIIICGAGGVVSGQPAAPQRARVQRIRYYSDYAGFTFSSISNTTADVFSFADHSKATPSAWQWVFSPATVSFLGGTSASSQNPNVAFNDSGTYSIKLIATYPAGAVSITKFVHIERASKPIPAFAANHLLADSTMPITFTDSSGGQPTAWQWSFTPNTVSYAGGSSSTSQNPVLTFLHPGLYTVKLKASNIHGSDSLTRTSYIRIIGARPVVAFGVNRRIGNMSTVFNFTDSSSNLPGSWQWRFTPNTVTFVNGSNSNSQSPSVRFNAIGQYSVSLVAGNIYGSDSITKTALIDVGNAPVAAVGVDHHVGVTATVFSLYDSSANAPAQWSWSFSPANAVYVNGTSASSQNPQVQLSVGTYSVTLRVANAYGNDSITKSTVIDVGNAPVAAFGVDRSGGSVATTFSLHDSSLHAPAARSWSFSPANAVFVNGTTSGSQHPQVQFSAIGVYSVTLRISNSYGSDSLTKVALVQVGVPPAAGFTVDHTSGNVGLLFSFTDTSLYTPTSRSWTITPASFSYFSGTGNSVNPQVIFSAPGIYSVSLVVSNTYGSDTVLKTNLINIITTGLNELSAADIMVYPNPSGGRFMLSIPLQAGSCSYVVTTMTGQLVQQGHINAQAEIDLGQAPVGIYLLRLNNAAGNFVKKLIIR